MIRIQREATPPSIPAFSLTTVAVLGGGRVTKAQAELEAAKKHFTNPANFANDTQVTKEKFTFKVYKNAHLARELERIFGNKCAYCESRFGHVTPREIEHFRPKSKIENKGKPPLSPGYWWLACDWTNLLVSCVDCNRKREHAVPGQSKRARLGKHTQFPLRDEAGRVRAHTGDISTEEPYRLLLNPCIDDPEAHLAFDDNGLVHARGGAGGTPSEMATVSIEVYALQRKGLVEEREQTIRDVQFHFDLLLDAVVDLGESVESGQSEVQVERRRNSVRKLKLYLTQRFAPGQPYLAMLRDYVRRTSANGGFAALVNRGVDPEDLLPRN